MPISHPISSINTFIARTTHLRLLRAYQCRCKWRHRGTQRQALQVLPWRTQDHHNQGIDEAQHSQYISHLFSHPSTDRYQTLSQISRFVLYQCTSYSWCSRPALTMAVIQSPLTKLASPLERRFSIHPHLSNTSRRSKKRQTPSSKRSISRRRRPRFDRSSFNASILNKHDRANSTQRF